MITTILIDDEENALTNLEWQLKTYCNHIDILKKISVPTTAIYEIEKLNPDCIFLDIQMPYISGFDVLKFAKNKNFKTIITTAHEKYAIKAIKTDIFDYLLKPIDKDDLIQAVGRLSTLIWNTRKKNIIVAPQKKISIHVSGAINFYESNEIVFLKAESNYTIIFLTKGRKITLCKTLKEVEKDFDNPDFVRIHKSYLININHVQQYVKSEGGSILMSNNASICISRSKKELFFNLMQ